MLNDCIRIGLAQNKTSFMSLRYACYPELKKYTIASAYKNNAISRANGILSNYRKLLRKGKQTKTPHCWRPMITTCKGFVMKLRGNHLTLPSRLSIYLNDYMLKTLHGKELRSATISSHAISICYSMEIGERDHVGVLGIDMNYENMTSSDSLGNIVRLSLKDQAETRLKYREIKSHFARNDIRIKREIFGKYGKLQADKAQSEIHKHTARIIKYAKKHYLAVVMEDKLDNMQTNLYRRGNGQGKDFRFKLNGWARGEAKRQLEYKGKREGVLVLAVNPRGTSANCSKCGNRMIPEENRMLHCTSCNLRIDRDVNAAINIRSRGLEKLFSMRFKPIGLPSEAMKGNPMKELATEVILKADGSQLSK